MSKREFLRIVEENRDHSNITRPNKNDGEAVTGNNDTSTVENPG